MVRAQGADLAVSGSVDLADASVDARLTMLGAAGPGALANTRPEVLIALKGPIDAAKRTTDVAALASWLALRAVEQQSKKLDVLEGRDPAPPLAPVPSLPAPGPAPSAAQGAALIDSTEPKAAHPEPELPRPRPARAPIAPKSRAAAPVTEQLPPLPPPTDIRPLPVPRAPRPAQGVARQPPRPLTPPAPRSLSEILFGN